MVEVKKEEKGLTQVERALLEKFRGKGLRKCRFCGTARGLIRKYKLQTCRRCFREVGEKIGFRKY